MKTISARVQISVFAFAMTFAALSAPGTGAAQSVTPAATTVVQTPPAAPQPAAPERSQTRRPPRRPATPVAVARVTVIRSQTQVGPQVVTIVHRLNGIKMLRLLLRQSGERGIVANLDPQVITNDAHASIIAGWAMGDGKTIAARLPQAAAEIEFAQFSVLSPGFGSQFPGVAAPRLPATTPQFEPDLIVITRDGQRLKARYVGLDGQTGLSVLQVNGPAGQLPVEDGGRTISEGQRVQLFAPQPTTQVADPVPGITYVQIGEVDALISNVARAGSGKLEGLTVSGARFSADVVGSVACDDLGVTLGIVDGIDGNDARIVPAEMIRAATRRVLERQSSVPRPLLGVSGQSVEFTTRSALLANGWQVDQLTELIEKKIGILLTAVMPGTPAALAQLHAGDVILRVNEADVKSAEEFSSLLGDAGSGSEVKFTVRRPTSSAPMAIDVKLGGSFEPIFKWPIFEVPALASEGGLGLMGIEATLLSPRVAAQMGAQGGLLVVAVQPDSPAARGGMREGDVIESIDGRSLRRGTMALAFAGRQQKKHVFSLVRDRVKKQVVLELVD